MNFRESVIQLLFPPRCAICDGLLGAGEIRTGKLIHPVCRRKLCPVGQPQCCHCGRPITDAGVEYCFDCEKKVRQVHNPYWKGNPASYFLQGKAVFVYQGPIVETMYRFKYSNRREYAQFLASEAVTCYGDWIARCGIELVAPIPVSARKQRLRGYNQAGLLAEKIARLTGLDYESDALIRVRDTAPQKQLNVKERKNNLKSAFQAADFVVKYNCILLVDDIYTTGCTAEAAAEALYNAGIKRIYFLAACTGKGV